MVLPTKLTETFNLINQIACKDLCLNFLINYISSCDMVDLAYHKKIKPFDINKETKENSLRLFGLFLVRKKVVVDNQVPEIV